MRNSMMLAIAHVVYSGAGQLAVSGTISTSTPVAQLPNRWQAIMPTTMAQIEVICFMMPLV